MVGWWVVQHGKCCVHAKRMFSQNSRINEKKNWPGAAHIYFIKGNNEFYNRAKLKQNKIDYWAVLEFTKRCGIATFGVVCLLRKVHFVYTFMTKP